MNPAQLLFVAEASTRYHRARAAYFDGLAKTLTIASVVMGGGAFATLLANLPALAPVAGLVIALLNAYRLVGKPEQSAAQHRDWLRRWSEMLGEALTNDPPPKELLNDWIKRRQKIESECSGDMVALKAYCFNQALFALGRSAVPYPLAFRHRLFKNLIRFTHAFDAFHADQAQASAKAERRVPASGPVPAETRSGPR